MAFATYTIEVAPGCTEHDCIMIGAGGGGGGGYGGEAGGGGAGGAGAAEGLVPVVAGQIITLQIGLGGAGGLAAMVVNGETGGDSDYIHPSTTAGLRGVGGTGGQGGYGGGNPGGGGAGLVFFPATTVFANTGSSGVLGGPVNPGLGGTGAANIGGAGGAPASPAVGTGGAAGAAGTGVGGSGTGVGAAGGGGGADSTANAPAGGDGGPGTDGLMTLAFFSNAGYFEFTISPDPTSIFYFPPGVIPMYGPNPPINPKARKSSRFM